MHDYMRALQRQFCAEPESEYKITVESLHRKLSHRLNRKDRKLLLRLVDAQEMLAGEISLASFTAGFQLAVGLARELSLEEPYSFNKEEERHALEAWERRDKCSKSASEKTIGEGVN